MVTNRQNSHKAGEFYLRVQVLFLILISLALFYPSIFAGFNSLDDGDIALSILNASSAFDAPDWVHLFFRHGPTTYYRPLVWTSFIADQHLHLCDPSFMHLENILLHTGTVLLIFFVSQKLIGLFEVRRGCKAWVPFLTALIVAVHPVNTEAVNWIAARTDLMAGFFVFLSLLCLLLGLDKRKVFIAFSVFFYLLALLSKEVAAPFVLVVGILLYFYRKKGRIRVRGGVIVLASFFLVIGLYVFMRGVSIKTYAHQGPKEFVQSQASPSEDNSLTKQLLDSGVLFIKATGFYFRKLFWPWPLNFAIVMIHKKLCFMLGLIAMGLMGFLLFRNSYLPLFGLIWAFLFMLPAMVVIYTKVAWTPLAERYVYVSSFGAMLFLSLAFAKLAAGGRKWKYAASSFLICYLMVFGYTTYARNIIWQDNLTLYADTVSKSPGFPPVHNQYALALLAAGKREEAREQFQIAARLARGDDYQYVGKANALLAHNYTPLELSNKYYEMAMKVERPKIKAGLLKMAIKAIGKEIAKGGHHGEDLNALYEKQIQLFEKMAEIRDKGFYFYKIGQRYLALGMNEKAVEYFKKTAILIPDSIYGKASKKLITKLTTPAKT